GNVRSLLQHLQAQSKVPLSPFSLPSSFSLSLSSFSLPRSPFSFVSRFSLLYSFIFLIPMSLFLIPFLFILSFLSQPLIALQRRKINKERKRKRGRQK